MLYISQLCLCYTLHVESHTTCMPSKAASSQVLSCAAWTSRGRLCCPRSSMWWVLRLCSDQPSSRPSPMLPRGQM